MKGAFSNPDRELGTRLTRIFSRIMDTGFPQEDILHQYPPLHTRRFCDFHKKYYHPLNAHILLYGNADLDKELEFLDSQYLSKYDKIDTSFKFPASETFYEMKSARGFYPVTEGSNTDNQTYLTLSFVAG